MPYFEKLVSFASIALSISLVPLRAQNPAPSATPVAEAASPVVDQAFIHKQFGEEFSLV